MKKIGRFVLAVLALGALSACSIKQEVRAAKQLDSAVVCLITNPQVKPDFERALQTSLRTRGYEVRPMPAGSSVKSCPVSMTYTAHWRWDLALYLAYAELRVFKDGQEQGSAIYDSLRGGANMGKFINAESKVTELTSQLMPQL